MDASAAAVPAILVVHGDRKTQRALHRILGATRISVDVVDSAAQGVRRLEQAVPRLLVVDHKLLHTPEGAELTTAAAARGTQACLVLVHGHEDGELPALFATGSLTNLFGNPMPLLAEELTVTALKLLRADLFGLEKYLSWGVDPVSVELADTAERPELVEALGHDVRERGLGARIATMAALVADELLSNALYNAPIDAAGRRPRVDETRHKPRALAGRERVTLRYACDARYLAIEINDHFGSVDRATVLGHLAKASRPSAAGKIEEHRPGAGMGLGLAYSCCNHLVFNIDPGVRTEVIGLIDVRYHPGELGAGVPSFNVFVQQGGK